MIARDFKRHVISTLQVSRTMNEDPFKAEAYGTLLAAIFYKEMGVSKIMLEGNALQVVNMIKRFATDLCLGGLLIEDAQNILKSFTSWSTVHTNRSANMATHCLTKVALDLNEDMFCNIFLNVFGLQF